jgi:hypothetical protein
MQWPYVGRAALLDLRYADAEKNYKGCSKAGKRASEDVVPSVAQAASQRFSMPMALSGGKF